jgi:hypothetical protein
LSFQALRKTKLDRVHRPDINMGFPAFFDKFVIAGNKEISARLCKSHMSSIGNSES